MRRPLAFEHILPALEQKHSLTSSTGKSAIVLLEQFRQSVIPGQANDVVAIDICVEVTYGMNAEGQVEEVMNSIHYRPVSQLRHPLIIYILATQRTVYAWTSSVVRFGTR